MQKYIISKKIIYSKKNNIENVEQMQNAIVNQIVNRSYQGDRYLNIWKLYID